MRITGGLLRGRSLYSSRSRHIRSTLDSVRESIFSMIGQDLSRLRIIDLFCGSGILGIEALSRGAQYAAFIDNNKDSLDLTAKNLQVCNLESKACLIRRDLSKGIPLNHPCLSPLFDLVFMDPPYQKGFITGMITQLSESRIMAPSSILIAETSSREEECKGCGMIRIVNSKIYGDTWITIYEVDS